MDTNMLKKFAQNARRRLLEIVGAKVDYVLTSDTPELRENAEQVGKIRTRTQDADQKKQLISEVAYIWFNRFIALRFMDANNYNDTRVIAPQAGQFHPQILAQALDGIISSELDIDRSTIDDLLDGKIPADNPQNEVYRQLLKAVCHQYNSIMPFMFEELADYTELLMPDDLLSPNSILADFRALPDDDMKEVESIGWMYQFYISEKKDEVIGSKKAIKKEDIPAATQLFTPNWIVRYMVENSLGRLWLQNHPESRLLDHMEYYIEEVASDQGLVASNSGKEGVEDDGEKLQGSDCLAESDGFGRDGISSNQAIPGRGTVRTDQSSASGCGIDPLEHSRGAGQTIDGGVQELSVNSQGLSRGGGNSTINCNASQLSKSSTIGTNHGDPSGNKQNASSSNEQTNHWPLTTSHLKISSPEEIKFCDPACGSGHILVYAFDLLFKIYEEELYEPKEIPELILKNNLFGIELDERAAELASFALMMKARQYDRRLFRRQVTPNVLRIEAIDFADGELNDYMNIVGRDMFTEPFLKTMYQFKEADNLGSLIRPELKDVSEIRERLTEHNFENDLLLREPHQKVSKVLEMTEYLSQRYHCVVANPPYMGSKNMNAALKQYANKEYPDSKGDLFAMFIERGFDLIFEGCYSSMVTMQSWMFLSSYEKLRERLLSEVTIECMVHMANMVMGIAFGTSATVWKKKYIADYKGAFCYVEYEDIGPGNKPLNFPPDNDRNKAAN